MKIKIIFPVLVFCATGLFAFKSIESDSMSAKTPLDLIDVSSNLQSYRPRLCKVKNADGTVTDGSECKLAPYSSCTNIGDPCTPLR